MKIMNFSRCIIVGIREVQLNLSLIILQNHFLENDDL